MLKDLSLSLSKKALSDSYLFDPEYYRIEYKLYDLTDKQCVQHYVRKGWKKGYKPSKYFDLDRFCSTKNKPVFSTPPLIEFLKKQKLPGFQIPTQSEVEMLNILDESLFFNDAEYLYIHPDVAAARLDPKLHYVKYGWKEGRNPRKDLLFQSALSLNDGFSFSQLVKKLDAIELDKNLKDKFCNVLIEESLFSAKYYLEAYPDVNESGLDPLDHFYCHGMHEKRQPYESFGLREALEKTDLLSMDQYLGLLREFRSRNLNEVLSMDSTTGSFSDDGVGCKQVDVLVVVKNYHLPSAIWRANFFAESLRLAGVKSVVRSEKECLDYISNSSIVFLQKFTNVDALFLEIINKAKESGAAIWGDMDDIFHPDYIKYSGQALTGLWNQKQQDAISSGFMRVVSRLDTLLVSTPKIKNVFELDFPNLKVLVRRNKLPERYMTRRSLPKIDTQSFKMIYPSGSLSHKKDFEPVADILFDFLKRFKDCSLTLLGGESVQVPKKLLARDNVIVLPAMNFSEMMDEIEAHDLLLAPLLINDFNHAKSNIKFVEAAAVKVPVMTTSVSEFSTYIENGVNGFLEDDFTEWGQRLLDFRRKPELLSQAGQRAYETVVGSLTTNSLENGVISEIKGITQPNIEKRYPNKSHQKYPNWLLEQNKYISTVGSSELIQRINDYIEKKSKRGRARYVVYTCLSNHYDSLKIPEFLDVEVDYICFSDVPVYGYGVWEIKSYSQNISDPTRISRHPKILPHLYLADYESSLYMDANILPVQSMMSVFKGLSKSGAHVAGVIHPDRDCIYKEAEACKRSQKDDPDLIDKAMDYLRSKKFPENFGLFENNLIYRKHNEIDVIQAMELWWSMYSKYSKRDQLSYMFSLYQTGIKPKSIFIDQTRNVRKSSEFLYFSHGEGDVWQAKL